MKKLINKIRSGGQRHIVVVGDVMLDEYCFGSVQRISPEAPVPIIKEEKREWSLGGAANVAANCKHIGCDVDLVGVIGASDVVGDKVVSMLSDLKISSHALVRSSSRVTTHKKRFLSQNHQLLRVDCEDTMPLSVYETDTIKQHISHVLRRGSVVLISDYSKGVITRDVMEYVLHCARDRKCTILVDPKDDFEKYYGVDYIKPNAREFARMVSFFDLSLHHTLEENGRLICDILGLKGLIVTQGERGIVFVTRESIHFSPACKREVFDLTGAGDTVFAFLGLGLAHDIPMDDCLRLANYAAAVAVGHLKTYAVSLDELIDSTSEPAQKIYTEWPLLKIELDWLRTDRKRVVFTNGCFDVLHPGHVHILKEAKRLGDILVVGINGDASISRLKGPSRPINTLSYRTTMLSAMGFVDFVVVFDQDTPEDLIAYIRPNVLVKGGDYEKTAIIGFETVMSYGGEVHTIDLVPGFSTTSFIHRLSGEQ